MRLSRLDATRLRKKKFLRGRKNPIFFAIVVVAVVVAAGNISGTSKQHRGG